MIVLEAILWANISLLLWLWPPPNGPCIFKIKYLSQKLTSRPLQTPSGPSCGAGCSRSQCVLGSYSWGALLSPPRFPTCIPTLSTSLLKMFPFLFSSLLSQLSCLTLFFLTSSFFSLLPLLFSSSILILFCSFPPLHPCPPSVTVLSSPPHSFRYSPSTPEIGELGRARSPGIHQHRLGVFLVMGA